MGASASSQLDEGKCAYIRGEPARGPVGPCPPPGGAASGSPRPAREAPRSQPGVGVASRRAPAGVALGMPREAPPDGAGSQVQAAGWGMTSLPPLRPPRGLPRNFPLSRPETLRPPVPGAGLRCELQWGYPSFLGFPWGFPASLAEFPAGHIGPLW